MQTSNGLRTALDEGTVALGAQAATMSESMIEVYGNLGLDFVWIDLEHKGMSPYDSTSLENFARAAKVSGTNLLVRIPVGDPHLIRKVLDTGVRNIVIPQVETATEVKRAVKAARFTYAGEPGERGSSFSRANGWGKDTEDYASGEDKSVCLGVMIENMTAMGNLEEILSVPELGFIRIGHGDLSVSLGHPIDSSHSEVTDQIEIIETKAKEHGVPIGRGFNNPDDVRQAINKGYQVITIGRDISIVRSVIENRFKAVQDVQ